MGMFPEPPRRFMFRISEIHKMLIVIKSQTVFVQITTVQDTRIYLSDIKENGIAHKTK